MPLSITRCAVSLGALAGAVTLVVAGCEVAGHDTAATAPGTAPATAPAASAPSKAPAFSFFGGKTNASEKGGAELWAETCSRCHNLRSPSTYGPAQWDVALYDMRVRANLTGEEQRKVLEFLKAASQ